MKRTVSQWANIQYALRRIPDKDVLSVRMLDSHIEHRTYGKVWSSSVGIGLSDDLIERVHEAEQWLIDNPDE